MNTVTFYKENQLVLGVKTEKGIIDVKEATGAFPTIEAVPQTVSELVSSGEEGKRALEALVEQAVKEQTALLNENELTFGPSVDNPQKIICVGLNYKRHADEIKMEYPKTPILFSKFANALAGHNEEVVLPPNGKEYDYEAELAIVIGKVAKDVKVEDALSYVYGYTNGNDLSARDFQFRTHQWLLGKTVDGFCPIGPSLVSKEEIDDPNNLSIRLSLNGELRQNSNTSDMIFNCAEIISYISQHMTLLPGDIILTGTPEGVIMGEPEETRTWLKAGDEVTVEIEKLGSLTTKFI
ncbi:fumarylacetoacetate hydrolase family protein [Halalkalibacter nanhaiisediminis]|uniref:2-keto-4-pentenoate hydratase/2-oxohepta-3-ene-1,7-dioic acid hydratase in catechol pathway n=1 Tax=Halalkalibacter nanhaiisediminis TaxID=688079 RepID=A0A562QMT4_9BACI|nr:fumarylacetoacetate hydrolase family protein [Halalkalibacter nanhaiisediminis]TWI58005.1 2-keto-4-pentenoate hydratase/2-oxohepta-3-ene-1,7-dioic acid hydratase in catechol pathway [Halalkalibacter nanhaiisediminis]